MTTGQSLWVGAADDLVLSAQGARSAMAGQWATNSIDPFDTRLGLVFSGDTNLIGGTSGLNVTVDPHHFIGSKASANGPYLGPNLTSTTVAVPAAPALGNKRIDVVWVAQTDKHATVSADASTAIIYGYTPGTATSGAPAKPALVVGTGTPAMPAGAIEVGTVTWDSTSTVASATNAAQCTLATTGLWTVPRGTPIPVRSQTERDGTLTAFLGLAVRRLDLGGRVEIYDGSKWTSPGATSATKRTTDYGLPNDQTLSVVLMTTTCPDLGGGVAKVTLYIPGASSSISADRALLQIFDTAGAVCGQGYLTVTGGVGAATTVTALVGGTFGGTATAGGSFTMKAKGLVAGTSTVTLRFTEGGFLLVEPF